MLRSKNITASALFVSPAFLIYLVFMIVPIILSFRYSFYEWNGIGDKVFSGLDNYLDLFKDKILAISIKNSLLLTFWAVTIQLPLGLFFAVILTNSIRFKKFFQTVFFMPVVLSTAVLGILWTQIYDPNIGLLNQFLHLIGLGRWTHVWLGEVRYALGSIIAVVGWQYIGFYMVIYYAALQNIPEELLEAAKMDGANQWYVLTKILIPLIWHVISFTIIFAVVGSLKYFDLIYIMTGGAPNHTSEVIASYMVKQAFQYFDFGYASTISVVLFLLGVSFALGLNRVIKREVVKY